MAQLSFNKCFICNKGNGYLYCRDCENFLCKTCKLVHDVIPATQHHTVIDANQEGRLVCKPKPVCGDHKKEYVYYCNICDCLICSDCTISVHSGHSCCNYMKIVDQRRQSVKEIIGTIKAKVQVLEDSLNKIKNNALTEITSATDDFDKKVNAVTHVIGCAIDRVKNIYKTTASDYQSTETEKMTNIRANVEHVQNKYKAVLLKFEHVLLERHDVTFLLEENAIQLELKNLDEIPDIPTAEKIPSFSADSFTDQIIDELQEKFNIRILKENEEEIQKLKEIVEKSEQYKLSSQAEMKQCFDRSQQLEKDKEQLEQVIARIVQENIDLKAQLKTELDSSNEPFGDKQDVGVEVIGNEYKLSVKGLKSSVGKTDQEEYRSDKKLDINDIHEGSLESAMGSIRDKMSGININRSLGDNSASSRTNRNREHADEKDEETSPKQQKVSRQNRVLTDQFTFNINNIVNVKLLKGDITDCQTSVIVCPQDEWLKGTGKIARAIHSISTDVYRDPNALQGKHLTTGEVLSVKASVSVKWKYVFHVLQPRLGLGILRDPQWFEKKLAETVYNLLVETERYVHVESISIPLLGESIDEKKYPAPIPTCSRGLVNGVIKYASMGKKNIYIEVWGFEDNIVATLLETFNERITGTKATNEENQAQNTDRRKKASQNQHLNTSYQSKKNDYNEPADKTSSSAFGKTLKADMVKEEKCCICWDNIKSPKKLNCGHVFCKECIDTGFTHKKACPSCHKVFGKLTGNQPYGGIMTRYVDNRVSLAGYHGYGHIKINYFIPSGLQGAEHPSPGKRYDSLSRSAFLPNNEEGNLVADLLRLAFDQRLIFTIGQSRTTGQEGVVTWNDISHKTRMDGGPQRFGYPDTDYLNRVLEELAAKGITKDSLKDRK